MALRMLARRGTPGGPTAVLLAAALTDRDLAAGLVRAGVSATAGQLRPVAIITRAVGLARRRQR